MYAFVLPLLICALLVLIPTIVLLSEVMAALFSPKRCPNCGERPPVAIVMPAHNESSVLASTIRVLRPQLAPGDRLLVVADNCTDDTGSIAAAEGAEVLTREDAARRGKGYALDFGVRHLQADPPPIVMIIDADCQVAAGAIDRLARACAKAGRPVQALYLMQSVAGGGLKMRVAEFAFTVKNRVRPLGLRRLGLPCQLMGTGMAFPWECLSTAPLATNHIAEDLKLGIELAQRGTPALFCPEALVTSTFAATTEGSQSQRTRWEHGHLAVILSDAPRLLLASLRRADFQLLALALDLLVPPLALLAMAQVLMCLLGGILYAATRIAAPLIVSGFSVVLLFLAVFTAWVRYGRGIISLTSLGFAVVYALLKLPLYAKFLVGRQMEWVRSRRDGE